MFLFPKHTITLDISSTDIRLLIVKGMQVNRWANAPIEPGLVEGGLVTDPPLLGARIKSLMKVSKIKGKKVIASISGLHSVCRILYLPYTTEQVMEQTILETVKEIMPVPVEELYITRQIVANDENGQMVLVIGLLREQVDIQIQALKVAGIKPRILNLKSIALMRLVNQPEAYIANIESDSMDLALIIGGVPQIIRTVAPAPNITLEKWIEQVAQALEQTVRFYSSQHHGDPFPSALPLFLTGPLADNPDLVQAVQSSPLYSLSPLKLPYQYSINLPLSHYAVNIGLAMGQLAVPAKVKAKPEAVETVEAAEPVPERVGSNE